MLYSIDYYLLTIRGSFFCNRNIASFSSHGLRLASSCYLCVLSNMFPDWQLLFCRSGLFVSVLFLLGFLVDKVDPHLLLDDAFYALSGVFVS